MQDLWRLSAADLASLIRSKKVSAKEAATAALARLDAVNPKINAVVDHKPAEVLAQASAIDAAIGRGEDPGPLAGVPVTVKVNIDQEGFATTNGLKLQRDAIAKSNNPVIDNLRKSGAVILGRTNCPAFSYRWFTTNLIHGDTKNPRDPSITPGGSSGGAGVAVAAGIGHIAHGTDIAGSIRYPAYACGVHGLRPTMGRIAAFNAALPERPGIFATPDGGIDGGSLRQHVFRPVVDHGIDLGIDRVQPRQRRGRRLLGRDFFRPDQRSHFRSRQAP